MSAVVKVVKKVVNAAVDVVESVVGVVGDAIEWVVDEIVEPVVKGIGDVIEYVLDDPIKAIATVAAIATGNAWAIPLIDGAATLANGGSLGDAVKAAAISYAGGKLGSTAGQFATKAVADAGGSAIVANIVGAGTKSATTALVYGQDPLKAFATGGLQAGIAAGMGKISETMQEQYGSKFEDLQGGVKDTIFAGLAAELEGGNLSETQMGSIVAKYSGVGDAMNNFLKENAGFSDAQAAILTNATAAAVSKAIAGNPDGAGEAFFGSISAAGAEALKTIVDKPVNKAIDKVTGAYDAAEAKAKALNDTVEAAKNAADRYNSLQSGLAAKVQEQDRLKNAYDVAVVAYNENPSEAGANAANTAADKYNDYARALEADYNKNYKNQLANAEATFNSNNGKIADLEADYNDAMGWVVSKTEDLDAVLKPKLSAADKAVALSLRPNFDEDAYRKLNGLDADVDVYDHFLQQGQKLPTDRDGTAQVLNRAQDTLGQQVAAAAGFNINELDGDQLVALYDVVDKNVTDIRSITGLDFDGLVKQANNAITEATPFGGVLPTAYGKADGVTITDIVTGSAQLSKVGNEVKWQVPDYSTNAITNGGGNVAAIDQELVDAIGGVLTKSSSSYVSNPNALRLEIRPMGATLPEMINAAQSRPDGRISNSTIAQIAELGDEAGRLLDTYLITPTYENAKTVYNYLNEETGGGLGNAGSIAVGAGGEILQAVAGLAVIAGANPNNALGRTAKNMISLSGDMKSDEWKAAAEEMQANSANYDAEWRAANPGKEPSTAQKAYLKTAAIFGNIKDHPVQWISENVVSELLQEVPILLASGGTGNVAKRLLLEAGEAQAKKVAARVAIGTGVSLDAAEAFGGTAAGAFDEAYSTALNTGMSDQEATDYAMDVAQKAGSIAVITLAATMGVGGQALSKSLFGDKGSEFFAESYDAIKKQVKDGAKVTIKEGVTEGIEEALPQLYIGTTLHQIDPSYDVVGSVAEAAVLGKITGAGVAGGLYTGNAVADALLTTNPTVKEAITNAGSAANATQVLQDMGISDNEVLNNLLNTTYDTQYVTTTEAGEMFVTENPGFTPTDAEIEAFAGKKDESNLAAEVAAYVDPRFLDVDEVKAAAAAEGITLTDEQAEAYVGQKNEATAVADIAKEYDPQGTDREEAEQFFADVGYTPTEAEITARMGATPDAEQKENIAEYVDPRQVTDAEARKFYEDLGYNPTDAEIAQFVGQGGGDFEDTAPDRVETYVDPRQVTDAEAREFFSDLGYTPTDEQVAEFVAQVEETTQQDVISKYVDPRQVTQAEVQAIADEEGLTLTETLAATYLGQSEADTFQTEQLAAARAEYDPLATTLDEATQFFADTGYTATPEEIAEFVASKTEEAQTSAIGAYVDPRQVTAEEAQEFLSAIGYQPTQDEIDQFTGQVNDANFEVSQQAAVDEYVDPRFFDAGEVRAAYEELGLVDVTQEDVDRFVGQFDPETAEYGADGFESAQLDELRTYMPTATFNVIREVIGSPAVVDDPNTEADESKDATGIYAEFEAGATRDEALQTAIDGLSTELGVTKDEVLTQIGLTEETLGAEIDAVQEDVTLVKEEVTGLGEQITDVETGLGEQITDVETGLGEQITDVEAGLGEQITDVETGLGEQITDVETSLGADIQAVADLIGKPARDVTQTDVDFVVDLIAQENVAAETIQQYDVTGDGILDINDQNMLTDALQGTDVTLADTSMFTPATGLYLQQEQDAQAQMDAIAEMNAQREADMQTQMDAITDMNTQINTNIQTSAKERNINDMMQQVMASRDIAGQQVTVDTPDPMNIDYLYDISGESIFATPSQAQLFGSPYGGTRVDRPKQQAANTLAAPNLLPRRASGFAEGGQVEDETDMLLRILGDT